jgi:nucleoid-associated protein YgaU
MITPGQYYTVQPGDTLFLIAQAAYGDGNQWPVLQQANANLIGDDPNNIQPGWQLYIPVLG